MELTHLFRIVRKCSKQFYLTIDDDAFNRISGSYYSRYRIHKGLRRLVFDKCQV